MLARWLRRSDPPAIPDPDPVPPDEGRPDFPRAEPRASRRDRHAGRPMAVVVESLGQKVLHGWLQNRHQTLLPLTLDLRSMGIAERTLVLRTVAAAMAAGGQGCDLDLAQGALARIGAGERERRLLADAFAGTLPTDRPDLFDALQEARLGTHAYGAALLAVDQRDRVTQRWLAYLAARLALPDDAVASLHRRYRT